MAKQLIDYGTGMKNIIMNQLAKQRQVALDKYNAATSDKDFYSVQVRNYSIKMQVVLLRLRIVDSGLHRYDLGA